MHSIVVSNSSESGDNLGYIYGALPRVPLPAHRGKVGSTLRAQLLVLASLFLTGCAQRHSSAPFSDFNVEARGGTVSRLDEQLDRESASLHQYLLGQLALGEERIAEATTYFRRSMDLRGSSIPTIQVQLAELYLRQGLTAEALGEVKPAYERDPSDVSVALLYAGLLEATGSNEVARSVYRRLVDGKVRVFEPYVLLGLFYAQGDQLLEARQVFEELVRQFPNDPTARIYLGDVAERLADLKTAEESYRRAISLESDNTSAQLSLVRVLLRKGAFTDAQRIAKEQLAASREASAAGTLLREYLLAGRFADALEGLRPFTVLFESRSETRYRLAFLNMQRSNPDGAIRELSLLLALDPTHGQARYHVGSLLAVQGRVKEGLQEIAKIPQDHEMFVKSRTFAAFVQRQQGDLAGAERSIREALQVDRLNPQLISYLVLVLRDAGKHSVARNLLEEALVENPEHERLLFNYGLVLSDAGDEVAAMRAMERVIALNPENADALNFVAYGLVVNEDLRDLERARAYIERALRLRPNDPYFIDTIGWVAFHQNELDMAREYLTRSHAMVPDDAVIAEHLMVLLVRLKDEAGAVRVGRNVLERSTPAKSRDQEEALARIKDLLRSLPEPSNSPDERR